jgi:hypothetical protein
MLVLKKGAWPLFHRVFLLLSFTLFHQFLVVLSIFFICVCGATFVAALCLGLALLSLSGVNAIKVFALFKASSKA